jgi:hypothetical protein
VLVGGAAAPRSPYADRYVSASRDAIAAGRDETPPPLVNALPYVIGAVYAAGSAAALVVGAVFYYRRRRERRYW